MTRRSPREIEKVLDDLSRGRSDNGDTPSDHARGITAPFVSFEKDGDPPEIPEGWTWDRKESESEHGADFLVAEREGDTD